MDFNTERENNIIKNIAKEIVFECAQKGVDVTQELANYMVKLILLNPENGFSASEVMPRNLTQQLVLMVIDLLQQDTPAMNCIRMQVHWDSIKLNVAEMKKEYLSLMADKAEPYLNEIIALEQEDLQKMPKLIASYIMVSQNLGSVSQQFHLKETMAAAHSVFKRKEMVDFLSHSEEFKTEIMKNLAQKTTGIRLYLKYCGKAGEGLRDVKKLSLKVEECKEEVFDISRKIASRIDDIRETISNVTQMDYFLLDAFQIADIYLPAGFDEDDLNHCKKILAIMLQHSVYISDIQSILEEIDGNSHFYLTEYDEILKNLHEVIKGRETVPTSEVYDFFDRLGELWTELQSYFFCLEEVEEIMKDFGNINKEEYFAPTELEKVILVPIKAQQGGRKKSLDSERSMLISSMFLLDDEEHTLELNGFCAWTLYYTNGLLISGNPQVEVYKHQDLYYSFSTKVGRELWSKEPQYYLMQIYAYVRTNTELVALLNLYDALYRTKNIQLTKTVERKVATRVENTQTVIHPIERHWDKDYTFSIWELKKRALTLSRLVKCVTKSVQTVSPHSHFRASIGLLAAPDKDKQVQTKRDNSCVHPTIATYLYGLRGHREDKFRVVDLTRPVDESFERQIILEERPPCKERQKAKMLQPVPLSYNEPCKTSSSSDDKCDYYYSYDSNDSTHSSDSSGNNYYFHYNGEG